MVALVCFSSNKARRDYFALGAHKRKHKLHKLPASEQKIGLSIRWAKEWTKGLDYFGRSTEWAKEGNVNKGFGLFWATQRWPTNCLLDIKQLHRTAKHQERNKSRNKSCLLQSRYCCTRALLDQISDAFWLLTYIGSLSHVLYLYCWGFALAVSKIRGIALDYLKIMIRSYLKMACWVDGVRLDF